MYNCDMPKLTYTKNSIGEIAKRAEEGFILSEKEQETYQFITITSKQMLNVVAGLNEAIRSYAEFSKSVVGIIKETVEFQKKFAEQVKSILESFSIFDQINILVQIPKTTPNFESQIEPVRIFVQPNEPYGSSKSLSSLKRKHDLPLTAVRIQGKGFTLDGKYIKGMTRRSEVGQLFELMLRSDLKGKISDELIDEIKSSDSEELDYRARSYLIRDLKEILAGNKLVLNINRYRGIQQYHVKGLIKLIRKPKKVKKLVIKGKTN